MGKAEVLENKNSKKHITPDGLPVDICIFTIISEKQKSVRKSLPKKTLKLLLIKRKDEPFKDKWALPGGFSQPNETLYDAAKRELKEETNIGANFHLEQIKTIYYPGRDPRPSQDEKSTAWLPTSIYYAFVKDEYLTDLKAGDDAIETKLFSIEEALKLDFAFDHKEIIFGGLKSLCGEEVNAFKFIQDKMLQTTIAKEFLPKEFTISELLQVIQTVVPDFNVEKPNFIRKMVSTKSREGIIQETLDSNGEVKTSDEYSQRSAKLYKFSDLEPKMSIYNSTLQ